LTTSAPAKHRGVCSLGSVKEILLLDERRIALTELTIKLMQNQLALDSAVHIIDQILEER
jgi:hypothetical protein